jgi:hypothetical protein
MVKQENNLKIAEPKNIIQKSQPLTPSFEQPVEKNTPQTEDSEVKRTESKLDINISITAPNGMTEQQIKDALDAEDIKEKIYKIYEEMHKDFKKKK